MFTFKRKSPVDQPVSAPVSFPTSALVGHSFAGLRLCSQGCEVCEGVIEKINCTGKTIEIFDDQQRLIFRFNEDGWSIDQYDGTYKLFAEGSGELYIDAHPA